MYVQPQGFITLVLGESNLTPGARLVAFAIAQRRFRKRKQPHAETQIPLAELATECGMSRRAVQTYLAECVAAGWIISRPVYRDGRKQASNYLLADPTNGGTVSVPKVPKRSHKPMTEADRDRITASGEAPETPETASPTRTPLPPDTASETPGPTRSGSPHSGRGVRGVLRSKYQGGMRDDGAPSGVGARDDKTSENPPTGPVIAPVRDDVPTPTPDPDPDDPRGLISDDDPRWVQWLADNPDWRRPPTSDSPRTVAAMPDSPRTPAPLPETCPHNGGKINTPKAPADCDSCKRFARQGLALISGEYVPHTQTA